MEKLTKIEIGTFLKLFNRGGYVLDFSTNDFDIFTLNSIGVALCEKYKMSKGKSLAAYINDASNDDVIAVIGKGDETYQIINGEYVYYKSDVKVAEELTKNTVNV